MSVSVDAGRRLLKEQAQRRQQELDALRAEIAAAGPVVRASLRMTCLRGSKPGTARKFKAGNANTADAWFMHRRQQVPPLCGAFLTSVGSARNTGSYAIHGCEPAKNHQGDRALKAARYAAFDSLFSMQSGKCRKRPKRCVRSVRPSFRESPPIPISPRQVAALGASETLFYKKPNYFNDLYPS
jgi:hypothetical protein